MICSRRNALIFSCVLIAFGLPAGFSTDAHSQTTQASEALSEQHKLLVTRGTEVFQRCTACHRIGPDAENRIGPHLNNLIGRTAGSIAGARYSDAMKKAGQDGLKWDANTLDAFVADPTSFIEDTTMGLDGVEDAEDRKALIAYLSAFATGSSNIPETPAARGLPSADPGIPAEILAIKGDPEYGEYLSSECLTCHQSSGSNRGIPGIVGWPVEDFVVVMHAYKSRKRDNPVMQMMASQLGNDEIAALAAYFQQKGQ